MIDTRFTKLLGASTPIQLAGMPGITTPELVCAVANAGGVGMFGAAGTPLVNPESLERILNEIAKNTTGIFGVNFLMPFLDLDCVEVAARRSKLVEFFYGEPSSELIEKVHSFGALASWQVGSLDEAVAAENAGCDLIIVQGIEAGGHVRGTTKLHPLLSQTLEVVKIPVLAAGGIATGDDVAAVLEHGASGARVGTRFVAAKESGAHPNYKQALIAATASDTSLTETFSFMWPNAPHRVLNSAITAVEALLDDVVGEVPIFGRTYPVQRLSTFSPLVGSTGNINAMALFAGESVTNVKCIESAEDIVNDLLLSLVA